MSFLVLDIETVPDPLVWSPPADRPDAFPPPWAHRIVCLGWMLLGDDYAPVRLGVLTCEGATEPELMIIDTFSRMVAAHRPTLVTFNGRSFDLPVIAHRSLCHGVQLPWYYKNRDVRYRYSEVGHFDLCDAISDYGAATKPTLDALARLIGLPGKVGVDGSQVADLYRAGRYEEIANYCLADVAQTALLLLRFRLVQGELKHAEYEAKRDNLIAAFRRDERLRDVFGAPAMVPDPTGADVSGLPSDSERDARALPDTGNLSMEVG